MFNIKKLNKGDILLNIIFPVLLLAGSFIASLMLGEFMIVGAPEEQRNTMTFISSVYRLFGMFYLLVCFIKLGMIFKEDNKVNIEQTIFTLILGLAFMGLSWMIG